MNLVIATTNLHKLKEIAAILSGIPLRLHSLQDFPEVSLSEETGETYEENALQKARQVFEITQMPSLADDTGLEVKALGNRPGILSARYGENDQVRRQKLLRELKDATGENRAARFVCVVAFVAPGLERTFRGEVAGYITFQEKGSNGFGYDPIFFVPEAGKTYGEMSEGEKNSFSHRARALRLFRQFLEEKYLPSLS